MTTTAPPPLASRLEAIRERLQSLPDRLRVVAKVANTSGLMWELTLPALRAAAKALGAPTPNPASIFRIHAAGSPDKTAILWRDKRLTFRELDERMDRVALGLKRRGMGRGTSVLLMMKNRPEFNEVQGGTSRVGAAAVSISWRSTAAELVFLAQDCGAKAILFEHELWPTVEQALRSLPAIKKENLFALGGSVPGTSAYEDLLASSAADFVQEQGVEDDAAVVIYTSGTTGKPKGAVRKFPKDAMPAAMRFIA